MELCYLELLLFVSQRGSEPLDGDLMGLHFSLGLIQQLLVLLLQSTLSVSNLTAELLQLIVQILERT